MEAVKLLLDEQNLGIRKALSEVLLLKTHIYILVTVSDTICLVYLFAFCGSPALCS